MALQFHFVYIIKLNIHHLRFWLSAAYRFCPATNPDSQWATFPTSFSSSSPPSPQILSPKKKKKPSASSSLHHHHPRLSSLSPLSVPVEESSSFPFSQHGISATVSDRLSRSLPPGRRQRLPCPRRRFLLARKTTCSCGIARAPKEQL